MVSRPTLRIVDQELWDKAQARLAKLKVIYGMKPLGKKRGPAEHYRLFYEKTLLGGLVHCRACGARMIVGRGGTKRLICPNHRVGICGMSAGVLYAKAEAAILDLLAQLLQAYLDWLKAVAAATRRKLEQLARAMPQELTAAQKQLDAIHQQAEHLTDAIASGVSSPTVRMRLAALEAQKPVLEQRIHHLQQVRQSQTDLPADEWIGGQLQGLTSLLKKEMTIAARSLRPLLGRITAEQVLAPGKKRGFVRLHVTLDGWPALAGMLHPDLPHEKRARLGSV